MLGYCRGFNLTDVADRLYSEILFVGILKRAGQFAGKDTFMPQPVQGDVKTAETSEQIHIAKMPRHFLLHALPDLVLSCVAFGRNRP